jgi:GT2 family glycosyltransferase
MSLVTGRSIQAESPQLTVSASDRRAIDIIVPVYKSASLAARCLESLAGHLHELSSSAPRVIVINDSPGDGDVQQVLQSIARRHQSITVLENESNLGFVKSVNRGLAVACRDGRDVILVNADTETFDDTLRNLVSAAYADSRIGFASPRSNNASLCSLPHLNGDETRNPAESYSRWQVLSRTMPAFHFVPTAVGFYLYIKHTVLGNFGLLDPAFGIGYQEENDLILRANKAGFRAVLANNAFAYHSGSASFSLLGTDLKAHQDVNLRIMTQRHEEFLPLVRRYEASAHYRAEALLSRGLPAASGRLKIVFDLTSVGLDFNGTNEMSVAIVGRFHDRHALTFDISVICSPKAFRFHNLDKYHRIRRLDTDFSSPERFAVGVRLAQPFSVHNITVLEELAVINIFGMLDTIADDCGYLSVTHDLAAVWGHSARHADGLFFNSQFSESAFLARYPDALQLPRYARLLPTRLQEYKAPESPSPRDHVLIMGNHFVHKASDEIAAICGAALPNSRFIAIGKNNRVSGNVRTYKAGTLDAQRMESLYRRAQVVVLPSYVEGFGFGLLRALAMSKVVVARDIPVTREILSTYKEVSGVFLYADNSDIVRVLGLAMSESESHVNDEGAPGWDMWVDGFAGFCASLIGDNNIFERVSRRMYAGDLLRKSELLDRLQGAPLTVAKPDSIVGKDGPTPEAGTVTDAQGRQWRPVLHLRNMLALDGEEFIYCAYVSLLGRLPDSDGLVNYLTELQSGVNKMVVVSRLRKSSEWRRSGRPIAGYWWEVIRMHLETVFSGRR